jgi:hypothetical protein
MMQVVKAEKKPFLILRYNHESAGLTYAYCSLILFARHSLGTDRWPDFTIIGRAA